MNPEHLSTQTHADVVRRLLARERALLHERDLEASHRKPVSPELLRRSLEEVESALGRVWLGTWGTCAACGEPIEEARLADRPECERCSRCG